MVARAARINGPELAAAVKKMGPLIAYTTVADYVKHPRARYSAQLTNYIRQDDIVRAVPFGEGFIDYKAFFDGLKAIGYRGYVAYEMCEVLDGEARSRTSTPPPGSSWNAFAR